MESAIFFPKPVPFRVIVQAQAVHTGVPAGIIIAVAVSPPQAETIHSPASETKSSELLHMHSTSCTSQPIADTALVMQVTCFFSLVPNVHLDPDV